MEQRTPLSLKKMTENNILPVPCASFCQNVFWLVNTPFLVVPTQNDDPSGRIQHPSAWKHARTGHFEWTEEEVEVHNVQCPLVEHLSGRMPEW